MEDKTIDLSAELQAEDEDDLLNTLIAISVIAKRLAKKMTNKKTEDKGDVQALWTDGGARQSETKKGRLGQISLAGHDSSSVNHRRV